jgi:hypothetical protein
MLSARSTYGFQDGRISNLEVSAFINQGSRFSGAHEAAFTWYSPRDWGMACLDLISSIIAHLG